MTTFYDQTSLLSSLDQGKITCTRTPRGVLAHIPVMKVSDKSGRELYLADLGWSVERDYVDTGLRAFLLLQRLEDNNQDPSSNAPAFVSYAYISRDRHSEHSLRWMPAAQGALGELPSLNLGSEEEPSSGAVTWMDIHLLHRDRGEETPLPTIPINYSLQSPFRFPDINIRPFMSNIEYMCTPGTRASLAVSHVDVPWSGSPPATFSFACGRLNPALVIQVGLCAAHLPYVPGPSSGRRALGHADLRLWARAIYNESPDEDTDEHLCSMDHVDDWPDKQRCFKVGRLYYKEVHTVLSFTSRPSRNSLPSKQPCQLKAWMGFRQDCHLCPKDHESGCACSQAISVPRDN